MCNSIGHLQRMDLLKPYQMLSYHFAVPFVATLFGIAERPWPVRNETELLQALSVPEFQRYPYDDIRKVFLLNDVTVSSTCDVYIPTIITGVSPGAAGARRPRLTIQGANGLLVSHRHLHLENIECAQTSVMHDSYMCAVQAAEYSTLVVKSCSILASGSAIRGLDNSLIRVEDSQLMGITAMCVNHEASVKCCERNELRYYGEWSVQVCSNPLERPTTYPFDSLNSIEFDSNLPANIFINTNVHNWL